MSDHWPEMPDLTRALDRLADEVEIDIGQQHQLIRELADTDVTSRRKRTKSGSHRSAILATTAALLALAGSWAIIGSHNSQTAETAVKTTSLLTCALTPDLDSYLLDDGRTIVGATIKPPGNAGPYHHFIGAREGTNWQATAAQLQLHEALTFPTSVVYTDTTTAEVLHRIIGAACGSAIYVVVDGISQSELNELICLPGRRSRGPSGYVLVNPPGPPTSCDMTQPAILVGPDVEAQTQAWAQHLFCTRSTELAPAVRQHHSCTSSLLAATTHDQPWSATIDGEPLTAWIATIVSLPN